MAKQAFLGTGFLGSAFAEAVAKWGDAVVDWNRSPDKALAWRQSGCDTRQGRSGRFQGASGPEG
jgi:3-hydroxyisobutyrate dehydrogenase-like beta-hydroxyacid dehydrogenase